MKNGFFAPNITLHTMLFLLGALHISRIHSAHPGTGIPIPPTPMAHAGPHGMPPSGPPVMGVPGPAIPTPQGSIPVDRAIQASIPKMVRFTKSFWNRYAQDNKAYQITPISREVAPLLLIRGLDGVFHFIPHNFQPLRELIHDPRIGLTLIQRQPYPSLKAITGMTCFMITPQGVLPDPECRFITIRPINVPKGPHPRATPQAASAQMMQR